MERLSTTFEPSTSDGNLRGPSYKFLRADTAPENNFPRFAFESYSHASFAEQVHEELSPRNLIEEVLVDRLISASWTLVQAETQESPSSKQASMAERSMYRAISALSQVRDRPAGSPSLRDDTPSPPSWRSRLVMDAEVSESSPVIRGTWITVDQVISRIVEGWSWDDLLRDHPELTTDDIRACLAFTIEDEESR